MSSAFVVAAFVTAVNPPRVRLAVPDTHGASRARPDVLALGSLVVFAAAVVAVALADELLAALDVSPESFRIAAGVVLGVAGVRAVVLPHPPDHPVLRGGWAALVPVAFPALVTPELTILVLSAGADEPFALTLGSLAAALVLVGALGAVRRGAVSETVLVAGARLLAALLVAVGVALVVDGIRDV